MATESSSSTTASGAPSLPNSAEMVVSLTESAELVKSQENQQQPNNQQIAQLPILPQTPPQQQQQLSSLQHETVKPVDPPTTTTTTHQTESELSSRSEVLSQQNVQTVKPHPIGTACFDNVEVTPYHLMPQEVKSSTSVEDNNSRDSDYVDTPEPISENPILREMEETFIDPRFVPKYAYVVELSPYGRPRQTVIRTESSSFSWTSPSSWSWSFSISGSVHERPNTTTLVTAGIIASVLMIGTICYVKSRRQ